MKTSFYQIYHLEKKILYKNKQQHKLFKIRYCKTLL